MLDAYLHLKIDNSNLFRCGEEGKAIDKELLKERYRKEIPEKQMRYAVSQESSSVSREGLFNPYPDVDFQLDMDLFAETLKGHDKELFAYYREGLTSKQIIAVSALSAPTVYRRLTAITEKFANWYGDDHE
jgi:hypothetical protein